MAKEKLEKRKILGMYRDSAWHKDKWLIGQIVKVEEICNTYKGGYYSAQLLVDQPRLGEVDVFIRGVKLSKKRY